VTETLAELLSCRNRKILFIGIGNQLRQDDGIGVYISQRIIESNTVKVITVEVSIENYIGKINSIDYDTLVLIDCADIGRQPGTYELLPPLGIRDMTFNTHNISLKRISEFFRNEVLVLAIQPEKVDFGENLSYLVKEAGNKIIDIINKKEV
jgi:hydrogenase 3 maturation protease